MSGSTWWSLALRHQYTNQFCGRAVCGRRSSGLVCHQRKAGRVINVWDTKVKVLPGHPCSESRENKW